MRTPPTRPARAPRARPTRTPDAAPVVNSGRTRTPPMRRARARRARLRRTPPAAGHPPPRPPRARASRAGRRASSHRLDRKPRVGACGSEGLPSPARCPSVAKTVQTVSLTGAPQASTKRHRGASPSFTAHIQPSNTASVKPSLGHPGCWAVIRVARGRSASRPRSLGPSARPGMSMPGGNSCSSRRTAVCAIAPCRPSQPDSS